MWALGVSGRRRRHESPFMPEGQAKLVAARPRTRIEMVERPRPEDPRPDDPGKLAAWWLPAAAAASLVGAIHLGLVISASRGQVASWLPHLDGSCSVSKACRQEPAVHVFRALVLPTATVLAATWWVAAAWLRRRALAGPRLCRAVLALGLAGAVFLVLYATFLGTEGPVYRLLRRYGIYVFFGGTALAQLLVTLALARAPQERVPTLERGVLRGMQASLVFMLGAGPLNLVAAKLIGKDVLANVLEWWFGLALGLVALLLARVWRREGLALRVATVRGRS